MLVVRRFSGGGSSMSSGLHTTGCTNKTSNKISFIDVAFPKMYIFFFYSALQ